MSCADLESAIIVVPGCFLRRGGSNGRKHVLQRKDHLVVRKEDAVLFDTLKNTIIECNEVGFHILMLLDGMRSVGDVVTEICAEYDGEPAEIESGCIEFLSMSLSDGISVICKEIDK